MKLLAIAPYQGLLELMRSVADELPSVDTTLMLGNLDAALISAVSIFHQDFDVVISRGGTAQALEDEFSLPIISIKLSAFDILNNLHEADAQGKRVAIVGFENTMRNVDEARALFDGELETFPIDYEDELPYELDRIQAGSFDLVLGDTISYEEAQVRGIDARLLQSGRESVRDAFERALLLESNARKSLATLRLLREIIRIQGIRIAIFTGTGELSYTTIAADDTELIKTLSRYAGQDEPLERFLIRHGGTIYTVHTASQDVDGRRMVAFTVTSYTIPGKDRFTGISYLSSTDVSNSYADSTFNALGAGDELERVLRNAGAGGRPILLEGETGSGKPRAAQLIYLLSPYTSQPFIEIDCDLLTDHSWEFLTQDHRSPLYDSGLFIHFRSLHMLPPKRWRELLGIMQRSSLADRSKLVFSLNLDERGEEPEGARRISEAVGGFTIAIPPLRKLHIFEQAPERYLAMLARRSGSKPAILDEQAQTIVSAYSWPRGIMQFKQVMNWAYAAAEDGTITAATIREALDRDATAVFSASSTESSSSQLDLLKPLSETTAEIARLVVENYGGNKTAAAKTLGISRTTLWSILKRA